MHVIVQVKHMFKPNFYVILFQKKELKNYLTDYYLLYLSQLQKK